MKRTALLTICICLSLIGFSQTQHLQEFKRDIPAGYYIRPIPQGQIDGMEMTPEEKDAYQNPAYRN